MEIIYLDDTVRTGKGLAATIGFFDGVHLGHQFLINQLKEQAKQEGLATAVLTFSEHPRKVLQQDFQPRLLTTVEEKKQLLARLGIDYCIILPFTRQFAEITAKDFIQDLLCRQLNVKLLLAGYDHRFGKNREDGFEQFLQYGTACGMKVVQADKYESGDYKFSSTSVRNRLNEGDVKKAAQLLSYNYTLEGVVKEGNRIGRTIGFPTANIELNDKYKLIPREGVYAVKIKIDTTTYSGMLYIGCRPTLPGQHEKRIEAHIFDFGESIYGKTIRIEFIDFIRKDMRFDKLDSLSKQLRQDREDSLQALRLGRSE